MVIWTLLREIQKNEIMFIWDKKVERLQKLDYVKT